MSDRNWKKTEKGWRLDADMSGRTKTFGMVVRLPGETENKKLAKELPEEVKRVMTELFNSIEEQGGEPELDTLKVFFRYGYQAIPPFYEDEEGNMKLELHTLAIRVETDLPYEDEENETVQ